MEGCFIENKLFGRPIMGLKEANGLTTFNGRKPYVERA